MILSNDVFVMLDDFELSNVEGGNFFDGLAGAFTVVGGVATVKLGTAMSATVIGAPIGMATKVLGAGMIVDGGTNVVNNWF